MVLKLHLMLLLALLALFLRPTSSLPNQWARGRSPPRGGSTATPPKPRFASSGPSSPLPPSHPAAASPVTLTSTVPSELNPPSRPKSLLARYNNFLLSHPKIASPLQGLVLFTLSDVLAQALTAPLSQYSPLRTAYASVLGSFYIGYLMASWIRFMDAKVRGLANPPPIFTPSSPGAARAPETATPPFLTTTNPRQCNPPPLHQSSSKRLGAVAFHGPLQKRPNEGAARRRSLRLRR